MKLEPSEWSWQNHLNCGDAGEEWRSARSYPVPNNMKCKEIGNLVFFYRLVHERHIFGIAEVCAKYHPGPKNASCRFSMASIHAVNAMGTPVKFARIKNDELLSDMTLARQACLSVTAAFLIQWNNIMVMGRCSL